MDLIDAVERDAVVHAAHGLENGEGRGVVVVGAVQGADGPVGKGELDEARVAAGELGPVVGAAVLFGAEAKARVGRADGPAISRPVRRVRPRGRAYRVEGIAAAGHLAEEQRVAGAV